MVNPINGLRTMSMANLQIAKGQFHRPPIASLPEGQPSPFVKCFSTSDPEQARENVQICHPWIRGYVPFTNGQRYRHSRVQITLDRITVTRSVFSHVRLTAENDDRVVLVLAERGWRSLQGRRVAAHPSSAAMGYRRFSCPEAGLSTKTALTAQVLCSPCRSVTSPGALNCHLANMIAKRGALIFPRRWHPNFTRRSISWFRSFLVHVCPARRYWQWPIGKCCWSGLPP
jgi:hypothetical protein